MYINKLLKNIILFYVVTKLIIINDFTHERSLLRHIYTTNISENNFN